MADPVTWFAAASAASGLVSGASARAQGQAAAASYDSQASADEYNATALDQQADFANLNAGAREDMLIRRGRQTNGKLYASLAQSGVDTTTGSSALVQEQSADAAMVDALTAQYEGIVQAHGYNAQATQDRYQAEVARMNAGTARTSGNVGLAAGLLQGVANATSGFLKVK